MANAKSTKLSGIMNWLAAFVCVSFVGCGRSPLAPVVAQAPITLSAILAGQSNSMLMRPYLSELLPTSGKPGDSSGTPISCWAVDAPCWLGLKPELSQHKDAAAFVWWQGESDYENAHYGADLADFISRVRKEVGNPNLLVLVFQYGTLFAGGESEQQTVTWAASDPNAVYILTRDKGYEFTDRAHMSADGYRHVAADVLSAIKSKRGF